MPSCLHKPYSLPSYWRLLRSIGLKPVGCPVYEQRLRAAKVRRVILRKKGYRTKPKGFRPVLATTGDGVKYTPKPLVTPPPSQTPPDQFVRDLAAKVLRGEEQSTVSRRVQLVLSALGRVLGRRVFVATRSIAIWAGTSPATANRVMQKLIQGGSIRLLKAGPVHGVERIASVYDLSPLYALGDRPPWRTHRTAESGARYRTYADVRAGMASGNLCVCLTAPEYIDAGKPILPPRPLFGDPNVPKPDWCPF